MSCIASTGPELEDHRSTARCGSGTASQQDVRARNRAVASGPKPKLSPGKLAVRFTDTQKSLCQKHSGYTRLKDHDLITPPASSSMKAADEFKDKTNGAQQALQTGRHIMKVSLGLVLSVDVLEDNRAKSSPGTVTTMR